MARDAARPRTATRAWPAKAAAFLAVVTALGACSGGGTTSGGGGKVDPNGVLRYAYDLTNQFTNTFDMAHTNGDCDRIPDRTIYDTLVTIDKYNGNTIGPSLATSWTLAPDAKSLTLSLRHGVTFTDGTPFDSSSVVWNLNNAAKNTTLSDFSHMAGVDAVDQYTVRIRLKDGYALSFLYDMGDRMGMMASPKAPNLGTHPVGTGPYVLTAYQPDSLISVRRNANYWGTKPLLGGIDFVEVGVGPPAVTALKSGSVDLTEFQAESFAELKADAALTVVAQPTLSYLQLQLRNVAPFDNPLVREAVSYAIDKTAINKTVAAGQGEVATQPLPMASKSYDPALANLYPYDPQKAKQLLAQAGHPNGLDFTMAIPGGGIASMEAMGEIIQNELAQVGIRAHITRILGSDIATQYYIAGNGQGFAAERLAFTLPQGPAEDQFGANNFVAIWNKDERPDVTALVAKADALTDLNQIYPLAKQADDIDMKNALEVPIAFVPEFISYNQGRIGGTIRAPSELCEPADLSTAFVKK